MKKLEKILRETPFTGKTSGDFTSSVMKSIYSEAEADTVREASLEQLLKKIPAEKPSADFAAKVMNRASASPSPRPLLSLRSWAAVAAAVALFLGLAYFWPSESSLRFRELSSLPAISPVSAISVLAIGLLVLIDYLVRTRKSSY